MCAVRSETEKSDSRQKKEYKNYMKKGEIYTGTVEKMDFPNKGILHIGEEKVVVKNALPGRPSRSRSPGSATEDVREDFLRS